MILKVQVDNPHYLCEMLNTKWSTHIDGRIFELSFCQIEKEMDGNCW